MDDGGGEWGYGGIGDLCVVGGGGVNREDLFDDLFQYILKKYDFVSFCI